VLYECQDCSSANISMGNKNERYPPKRMALIMHFRTSSACKLPMEADSRDNLRLLYRQRHSQNTCHSKLTKYVVPVRAMPYLAVYGYD
jgi:hypothetical protein